MRSLVLISLVFLLASCAPRAQLIVVPGVERADTQSVFIATTRQPKGRDFGSRRSGTPRFLRYDISVPPARELGEISWPDGPPDFETDFIATSRQLYASTTDFRADLARAMRQQPGASRNVIIYVHGFNNNFADGVLRITQLAHDFEFRGVPVHYSWPSAGNPLGYAYDRDSVLYARDGLEMLIREVKAAGADSIAIVAHSVGSLLTMESLRQIAIAQPGSVARDIDGVILISPDIDVELFRSQAQRIGTLPRPFGIFVSKRDRALSLSARLTGQRNRLGNLENIEAISDLDITVVDVTEFSSGAGHFTAGSSPDVISIFSRAGDLDAAFQGDSAGRSGLIPGTVLTVQNATAIILSPVTELAQ